MSDENRKETRAGNTESLTKKLWSGETERENVYKRTGSSISEQRGTEMKQKGEVEGGVR